jgi:hypothetical protein
MINYFGGRFIRDHKTVCDAGWCNSTLPPSLTFVPVIINCYLLNTNYCASDTILSPLGMSHVS